MKIHIVTQSSSESTSVIGAFNNYEDARKAMEEAEENSRDSSMPSEYEIHSTTLK